MRVSHEFELKGRCPQDGCPDFYACVVRVSRVLWVEDIAAACADLQDRPRCQEELTAELAKRLGAEVETVGWHGRFKTTVVCGGPGDAGAGGRVPALPAAGQGDRGPGVVQPVLPPGAPGPVPAGPAPAGVVGP
jgi:hypothetical protein